MYTKDFPLCFPDEGRGKRANGENVVAHIPQLLLLVLNHFISTIVRKYEEVFKVMRLVHSTDTVECFVNGR